MSGCEVKMEMFFFGEKRRREGEESHLHVESRQSMRASEASELLSISSICEQISDKVAASAS
jgi:hypothetical protein